MYDIRVDGSEIQQTHQLIWKTSQYLKGFYTFHVVVGDFETINSSSIVYNTLISLCTRSACEVPGSFHGRPNDVTVTICFKCHKYIYIYIYICERPPHPSSEVPVSESVSSADTHYRSCFSHNTCRSVHCYGTVVTPDGDRIWKV